MSNDDDDLDERARRNERRVYMVIGAFLMFLAMGVCGIIRHGEPDTPPPSYEW